MRVGLRSARRSGSIAARPSAEPWAQRAMASARVASSATPSTPLQIELYGTRLAFAWRYQADRDAPAYDLRVDTIGGGSPVRLNSTPGGGLSSTVLGWPSFESGQVFCVRSCVGDPGGCQSTPRLGRDPGRESSATAYAVGGHSTVVSPPEIAAAPSGHVEGEPTAAPASATAR
jgi:hypothetical protein